jgi:hypothetical protein
MTNNTLIRLAKSTILELLNDCTLEQRDFFVRIYNHKDVSVPIETVVDNIAVEYLESAISLIERTILKNKQE